MKAKMSKLGLFISLFLTSLSILAQDGKLDQQKIDEITGLKGKYNEQENVYKINQPRTDVKVSVDQWVMPPFMGLTSWAAFTPGKSAEAMVMGDLVLFQDEVNPVMSAALDNGLQVTALHNHFFYDNPKVYFMHIGGEGKTETLARGVQAALAQARQIRAQNPVPANSFGKSPLSETSAISPEPLQSILGTKGETKDGMFKTVFGRDAKMPCGCEVGKEMGVNTWAAFAGKDDDAVVDGDFVILESELQEVLKSLRHSDINIVAIHNHMTGEEPRYLFLHYWGRGKAEDLAREVKSALKITGNSSTKKSAR